MDASVSETPHVTGKRPLGVEIRNSQSTKRQRVESAPGDDEANVDLMSLEEKIKALEQSLENSSSSSSSSENESDGDDDDLRIPALPPEQLPEYYMKNSDKRKASSKNKIRNNVNRDSGYWQKQLSEAMKSYVPSQNRPLYCRICKLDFLSENGLMEHRRSLEHKNAAKIERQMTYCTICDKQFTSVKQLEDHSNGKWHKEKLSRHHRKVSSRGRGSARGQARGQARSRGRSRGRGQARNWGRGQARNWGRGQARGHFGGQNRGRGRSSARGKGRGH